MHVNFGYFIFQFSSKERAVKSDTIRTNALRQNGRDYVGCSYSISPFMLPEISSAMAKNLLDLESIEPKASIRGLNVY